MKSRSNDASSMALQIGNSIYIVHPVLGSNLHPMTNWSLFSVVWNLTPSFLAQQTTICCGLTRPCLMTQVRNILTMVMTNVVVDKSTDKAEPHSICQIEKTSLILPQKKATCTTVYTLLIFLLKVHSTCISFLDKSFVRNSSSCS